MNTIARPPVGISSPSGLHSAPAAADRAPGAAPVHVHDAQEGRGALQGRQIGVGDSGAAPRPGVTIHLPPAVQMAVMDVHLQAPATSQARQAAMMRPAAQPQRLPSTSGLYVPQPGGLATNAAVLKALHAHAQAAGTVLTPKEIAGYVALGEHAVNAIQQPSTPLSRRLGEVVANTVHPPVVLSPNMETARGISWYVAACAAQQDVNQQAAGAPTMVNGKEVTHLAVKGSFVFKDPHNAVYKFLQSSPLAYSRISSHYNERSASETRSWGQPEQRGVEDYDRRLPGQNGAILFDKLRGTPGEEEMFIKFEGNGFPEVSTSDKRIDDQGQGRASKWQAFKRYVAHALSYIVTRSASGEGVDRKEHVHKGVLKEPVYKPFMKVMENAQKLGLATDMSLSAHKGQTEERGLAHLEETLARLKQSIGAVYDPGRHQVLLHDLIQAQAAITMAKAELGAQSDHLGIERRGAETHVDLRPPRSHLDAVHKDLTMLEPGMRSPQGALQPYVFEGRHKIAAGVNFTAVKDWDRMGISVNGTPYPGKGRPGHVASNAQGRPSTLEQGCKAFVQACGGNAVAAEWISRFAHQGLAEPVLHYLARESLGELGEGVLVANGVQTLAINTLPDGAVEVTMDYRYQNSAEDPRHLLREGEALDMHEKASLHATVTLRFDDPGSYTGTQVPAPVISAPLTYTTFHFTRAPA